MPPAQPNRSLMHGLACLQGVVSAEGPIGSRALARRLDLEHTRVNRLLGTLGHLGLVTQTGDRKYVPGPAIHVLSAQSLRGSGLLARALPHLRALADERLTLALGVLWRHEVCYLVHAAPGQDPADAVGAHRPYPAHDSILGLALLAAESDAAIAEVLAGEPDRLPRLRTEIDAVRRTGHAARVLADGRRSVAVAIGSPAVAAVSLTGHYDAAREPALLDRLHATADALG
ncbi:MAG: IclR family transcriptional regulator [Planctomycetota bacterium]